MLVELDPLHAGAEELSALAARLRLPTGFEADPAVDLDLRDAFEAAAALVERASGRALARRRFRVVVSNWGAGVALTRGPVAALLEVSLEAPDGRVAPVSTTAMRLDALARPERLVMGAGAGPPAPETGGVIRVDFEAGAGAFAAAPADLRAATLMIAARWYEAWSAADAEPGVPAAAEALLAPYRSVRL